MKRSLVKTLCLAAGLFASAAHAQSPETISIQLNAAETAGKACRLTFVLQNRMDTAVDALGFELVTFDTSEGVSGYTAVDFGAMPAGKTVVRQYDVGKSPCPEISRVLLNQVRSCDVKGAPLPNCLSRLEISSRSEIDFIL